MLKRVAVFTSSGCTFFAQAQTCTDGTPYLTLDLARARVFHDGEPCPKHFEFREVEDREDGPARTLHPVRETPH